MAKKKDKAKTLDELSKENMLRLEKKIERLLEKIRKEAEAASEDD